MVARFPALRLSATLASILGIGFALGACSESTEVSREVSTSEVQASIQNKLDAIDKDPTLTPEQKAVARSRFVDPTATNIPPQVSSKR
jgi:hypothetical protein